MPKRLGWIIGCIDKKSYSWRLNGFPDGIVTLGQQYNVGEKPTVIILYTYINRHAGTPNCYEDVLYLQPMIPPKRFAWHFFP